MTNKTNFFDEAEAQQDNIIACRRDLHRHPELAFEETRTAGIVADTLRNLGLEVQTGVGKTGVVGLIEGAADGPTVLIRADMDALPVHEQNEADYTSTTPGKMHACGHDGHTAVGLAVADLLSKRRAQMAGRVKLVFQPAEEIGKGARAMIDDGVMESPAPDIALGLHFWSGLETGQVAVSSGPVMAGADIFHITITGKGGHGALPQQTHDPVTAAAQIIVALNSVVSRNVDALDAAVLSVCSVQAGDAFNVIPGEAKLSGTFRTFKPEVRDLLIERSETIAAGVANAMGCEATLSVEQSTTPVYNDPAVTETVQQVASQRLANHKIEEVRTMGAEDMCEFLSRVPGCFFFVGSGNPGKGTDYAHHHPRFDLDEDALAVAAGLMATAAARYVLKDSD